MPNDHSTSPAPPDDAFIIHVPGHWSATELIRKLVSAGLTLRDTTDGRTWLVGTGPRKPEKPSVPPDLAQARAEAKVYREEADDLRRRLAEAHQQVGELMHAYGFEHSGGAQ